MAKRPTRSQADDSAAATPQARPRRSRATAGQPAEASAAPALSDTQAARGRVDDEVPMDLDERPGAEALTSESMASEPSEEDIRMRAYHRYLERGGGHGADFDDWLEAERELRHNRSDR